MSHWLRLLSLAAVLAAAPAPAQLPLLGEKKFQDFETLTRGAKEYDGLFRLHQKDDHVYAEIKLHQLDRPFLCPIAIARGLGMGGHTRNFEEQCVLLFNRVGD